MRKKALVNCFLILLLTIILTGCKRVEYMEIQVLPDGDITIFQTPHDHTVILSFQIISEEPNIKKILAENNIPNNEILKYTIPKNKQINETIYAPLLSRIPTGTKIIISFQRIPPQDIERYPMAIGLELGRQTSPILVYHQTAR